MSGNRALLLDYGGVLTAPVADATAAFEAAHGVRLGGGFGALAAAARTVDGGTIGALERGELTPAAFEAELRAHLETAGVVLGPEVALLEGLLAAMQPAGSLWSLLAHARAAGVATGVLSNSWGLDPYPMDRLVAAVDEVVLSGEVGLRKPDPAIYRLAADRLGVAVEACVFVDDLPGNVAAAEALGMVGVLHTGDDATTWAHVTGALEIPPPGPSAGGPVSPPPGRANG